MSENTKTDSHKTGDDETISISNPIIWIIGAVILLLVGWFAVKTFFLSEEENKLTIVDAPKTVIAGTSATFTWRIDGPPTTINSTSIRLGLESNPGDLTKETKPADTKYTDFVKDFANGKYNIPLQFVGNIKMDKPGKYYYRLHAIIKDKNYWTEESSFDVKEKSYGITIINSPKDVMTVNTPINFTWTVDGPPSVINNTSVRYGKVSTPGVLGKEVKHADTEYTGALKDFISGKYDIPLQFVGNIKIEEPGKYYYRFHALIKGQHFWSDENTFEVK